MIAASKGYRFLCVTDSRCNPTTKSMMEALGAEVNTVTVPLPSEEAASWARGWLMYARFANPMTAMCGSTSTSIRATGGRTTEPRDRRSCVSSRNWTCCFVGAGTTGTLMGCARFLREWHRRVHVVAVDAAGSVTFGGPPAAG